MSQVLQFNVPHEARLLCDNPVCTERATYLLKTFDAEKKPTERFSCDEHYHQMMKVYEFSKGMRFERLKTPGEYNPKEEDTKDEETK